MIISKGKPKNYEKSFLQGDFVHSVLYVNSTGNEPSIYGENPASNGLHFNKSLRTFYLLHSKQAYQYVYILNYFT
jgi:hypothetical protein